MCRLNVCSLRTHIVRSGKKVPAGLLMSGQRMPHARTPANKRPKFVSRPSRHARPTHPGFDPNFAHLLAPHGQSLSRSFLTPSALPLLQPHNSCHGACRLVATAAQRPTHTLTAITSQRARAPLVYTLRGAKVSGHPCCLCSPSSRHASPATPTRHVGGSPIRQQSHPVIIRTSYPPIAALSQAGPTHPLAPEGR